MSLHRLVSLVAAGFGFQSWRKQETRSLQAEGSEIVGEMPSRVQGKGGPYPAIGRRPLHSRGRGRASSGRACSRVASQREGGEGDEMGSARGNLE